ncbi:hypothetical protein II898_11000 [bacterium]|nr:hypothetical protein [bacterium]
MEIKIHIIKENAGKEQGVVVFSRIDHPIKDDAENGDKGNVSKNKPTAFLMRRLEIGKHLNKENNNVKAE